MIVTIACPAAHVSDANQLAMILGYGPADELTYGGLNWQDAAGNLYACASALVGPNFVSDAQAALARPAWDVEPYDVSLAGARRAQALVVLWTDGAMPVASPDHITAIAGMDGLAALAAMGLVVHNGEISRLDA